MYSENQELSTTNLKSIKIKLLININRGHLNDEQLISVYILSGTFIPNNPIAEAITLAVISESFNRNCFFSSDSAFITECSV